MVKSPFRRWHFVKCVDKNKIWADNGNYSNSLELNRIYVVYDHTNKYGDLRNGPMCIRVFGDDRWHKSSNFVKSNLFKWIRFKINKKLERKNE